MTPFLLFDNDRASEPDLNSGLNPDHDHGHFAHDHDFVRDLDLEVDLEVDHEHTPVLDFAFRYFCFLLLTGRSHFLTMIATTILT